MKLDQAMRGALAPRRFRLCYQPQIDLRAGGGFSNRSAAKFQGFLCSPAIDPDGIEALVRASPATPQDVRHVSEAQAATAK